MSVYSSWRVNGLFLNCSAWSLFPLLKNIIFTVEFWKATQLWRKINSNGDYRMHLFQSGNSGCKFQLVPVCGWWKWSEWWWEISCPSAACTTSPCLWLSCWLLNSLCINFVQAWVTSELWECHGLPLASSQRLLCRGGVLEVFVQFMLIQSYITLLY